MERPAPDLDDLALPVDDLERRWRPPASAITMWTELVPMSMAAMRTQAPRVDGGEPRRRAGQSAVGTPPSIGAGRGESELKLRKLIAGRAVCSGF